MRSPSISSVRFLNFTTPSPRAASPAIACRLLCPVTAGRPARTTKSGFITGCSISDGHDVAHPPARSPRGAAWPHGPVLLAAIANPASPSASQEHELHEEPSASCAQAQSSSRRSPTGVLPWGFVSWLRQRPAPEGSPARPCPITSLSQALSHVCHQLRRLPRTRCPDLLLRTRSGLTWTPEDGLYNLCQVVPSEGPRIRTGASSGPSRRYCRVFGGVSLTHPTLSRFTTAPMSGLLTVLVRPRWKTSRGA